LHSFCKACRTNFNIGHVGENDVRQHIRHYFAFHIAMPRGVSVWLKIIVTENRTSLNNSTLCSLLSCKINYTKPPSKYTPSKKTRRAAKSATHIYNTTKQ